MKIALHQVRTASFWVLDDGGRGRKRIGPQTAGSHRIIKGKIIQGGDDRAWRKLVVRAAQDAAVPLIESGPAYLTVSFYLPRPMSHFLTGGTLRKGAPWLPWLEGMGDADKLARSLQDALKGIAWTNDGQVVDLRSRKFYATTRVSKGGAFVEVGRVVCQAS